MRHRIARRMTTAIGGESLRHADIRATIAIVVD